MTKMKFSFSLSLFLSVHSNQLYCSSLLHKPTPLLIPAPQTYSSAPLFLLWPSSESFRTDEKFSFHDKVTFYFLDKFEFDQNDQCSVILGNGKGYCVAFLTSQNHP